MAIRTAMGASRMRVIRQLLTESVLLSLLGGAVGLLLAVWWSDLLVALGKDDIPRALHVGIDWRVLGFTLGLSLLTGLIFGLAPAFHSSKTELVESLKEGARGSSDGARRIRLRNVLMIGELAMAVVLLVIAGLLIQSLWRLQKVNSGLQPENLLTFNVGLSEVKYKYDQTNPVFHRLEESSRGDPRRAVSQHDLSTASEWRSFQYLVRDRRTTAAAEGPSFSAISSRPALATSARWEFP